MLVGATKRRGEEVDIGGFVSQARKRGETIEKEGYIIDE